MVVDTYQLGLVESKEILERCGKVAVIDHHRKLSLIHIWCGVSGWNGAVPRSHRTDGLTGQKLLRSGHPSAENGHGDVYKRQILFCMGNSDVPVGQYTQKILAYYDLDEAALAAAGVITYGSNVKEVTTQVSEASVDAGVVYCTDAYSAGLTPVDEATKEMCGQVIYPAAVMKNALHAEAAKEFLAYLRTDKAATVFESVGFTAL